MKDIILSQSEYEALLEEIHRLQARISELTALRDDLLYHICPALRAEYEEKIASLERELLAAEMYLRENQRILEILQAQMNQQKEPSFEEAEKEAREEFREYEDDLKRKAEEAENFKKHWENDTQWSEHDRREKEERKKEQQEKEQQDQGEQNQDQQNQDQQDQGEQGQGEQGQGEQGRQNSGENGRSGGDGNHEGRDGNGSGTDEHAHDGDGEDEFRDGDGSGDEFDSEEGSSGRNDTPSAKLKRLYRKIVKRLHPDVHPDATPREKELFNMACEAMQSGDLEMMERIWDEISGMDAPEDAFEDTPEGILKLKEVLSKLRERMAALEMEIRNIRSSYPYTMKSFLENKEAVEEKRNELQDKLKNLREANEKLVEFIRQMRQQMGM